MRPPITGPLYILDTQTKQLSLYLNVDGTGDRAGHGGGKTPNLPGRGAVAGAGRVGPRLAVDGEVVPGVWALLLRSLGFSGNSVPLST